MVTPIVPDMSGNATLTMLESSTAMMVPVSTVPATIHLCVVACAEGGGASRVSPVGTGRAMVVTSRCVRG
jgi:hypothetical protein